MLKTLLITRLLVFFVLNFSSLDFNLGFVVGCHETEREALLTFKHSLAHDNGRLSSWEGNDCCQWEGVGCNNITAHVNRLDLHNPYFDPFSFMDINAYSFMGISAPMLYPSLIALSQLKYLDLSGNDFQGSPIPGFIGSFKYLRYLNLSSSNFSGIIPSQLSNLSRLQTLDLSDFPYMDALSTDLHWTSALVSLQYLNMSGISISPMRDSMRAIYFPSSLIGLGLSYCGLSDPQPVRLFSNSTHLSNIQQLDLSGNFLQGSPPRVFSNMTSLTYLDLSENYFNDSALLWLRSIRKLEHLEIRKSLLDSVPRVFSNMTSLTYLDLSGNYFNDSTLLWLRSMKKLEHLDYSWNFMDSFHSFPRVFANMTSLRSLDLAQTNIKGSIPLWLSNLSELQHLDLSDNPLEGPLPRVFRNMTSLIYLDLSSAYFNGAIPLWLRHLKNLEYLDLSSNHLSRIEGDKIMGILGNLCKLKVLDWSYNSIEGSLEAEYNVSKCVPQNLEFLGLGNNMIRGTMPSWLGQFKGLRHIDMGQNTMHGLIPDSIASLSYLEELDLSHNSVNGSIPSSFKSLSSLQRLDLSHNFLNNNLPEGLGQCKDLVHIDLSSNLLEGAVSESHLSNLSRLDYLDLSYNLLDLNLSSNWSPPFQLSYLYMKSCKIQTELPRWITKQTKLSILDLSDNRMTGNLAGWFPNVQLYYVNISHNQVRGPVPYFSSVELESIDLSHNLLSGPLLHVDASALKDVAGLPVCQLPNLDFLDLQGNKIVGTIPDCWGYSGELAYINLSSNNLSGNIPMSMGLLLSLWFLKLSNNSLVGPIPPTFNTNSSLQILDLGENNLGGKIPSWGDKTHPNLEMLRLRQNQFVGVIPTTLCSLRMLQLIDFAHNNLTGRIPTCFGHLIAMKPNYISPSPVESTAYAPVNEDPREDSTMVVLKGAELQYTTTLKYVINLDLSCNALVGSIPEELTNLSSLIGLNLSHNLLTGNIPRNIGEMRSLESLDISNNNISGTIPSGISALTAITVLNLSYNNLHGQIPTGPQLQVINDPSMAYIGNPGLCGDPLPNKCKTDQPQPEAGKHDTENSWEKPLLYFVISSGFATGFWGVVGSLLLKSRFRFALFLLVDRVAEYFYVQVMVRLNRTRH